MRILCLEFPLTLCITPQSSTPIEDSKTCFCSSGYNIPTTYSPKVGIRFMSLFDKSVKMILPHVGKVLNISNEKVSL